ncbi:MAG TPA: Fe-Mn family superoxide dismutase, partial [Usitatibacter sp.]|nr:Fe-Mn family superoxide dismutase [Usitatibacter sp.]
SGWAWLVRREDGSLGIEPMKNAETPIAFDEHALLTLDVWEHAYYLDYQNRRPDYAAAVIDKLLNWDFAARQLDQARERKAA